MNQQLHAYISGRVQGVWYRANTQKVAQNLQLTGWVRNLDDGRVELLAVGKETQLNKLLDWCRQGPEGSRVTNIDFKMSEVEKAFNSFEITA
ncbi:MAG: acylphosphatase [Gammaproteobacteria bacterium]|nr:acylphosphatase [Gammaproteobacteria bacterium]